MVEESTTPTDLTARALTAASPPQGDAVAVDHKAVGTLYLVVSLVFLVVSGVIGVILRVQLAAPDGDLVSASHYSELFSYHGVFGVFFFLIPATIGLATAIVPLQIGAARLAFPRLQAFALWLTVVGGAMVATAPFVEGGRAFTTGWTLGSPVPAGGSFAGHAVDYVILGVGLGLVAAVVGAVNLVVTVTKLRAPGVTLRRLPLFAWAATVSSAVLVLALPMLIAALAILFVDRNFGGLILSGSTANSQGDPSMWPRLFWFGAYPALWALLIGALGVISEILPTFARTRIANHGRAMAALGATGTLAFFGWPSEVVGAGDGKLMFTAAALVVLLPVASIMVNWLLTLRAGRPKAKATPMLLAVGFLPVLALGLAAGAVSAADATGDLHANAFATGSQHGLYFLPATIALVAALHFWGPKLWGRHLSDGLGRIEALLLVGGGLAFTASMLVLGLQDMPLHLDVYSAGDGWQLANLGATAGGVAFGVGALLVALDALAAVAGSPSGRVGRDPWRAQSLEWTTTSPPPPHNYSVLPLVLSPTPALDLREAVAAAKASDPSPEQAESR